MGKISISLSYVMLVVLLILCSTTFTPRVAYSMRQTSKNNIFKFKKPSKNDELTLAMDSTLKPKGRIPRPSGPSPRHNSLGLKASLP